MKSYMEHMHKHFRQLPKGLMCFGTQNVVAKLPMQKRKKRERERKKREESREKAREKPNGP